MKGIKLRISEVAWSDHYSRLYGASFVRVCGEDGFTYRLETVFPVLHCDDQWNIAHGKPARGQEIYSIKRGKKVFTVEMSEAAVTEILSDFDFYTSDAMRGEYDPQLVRAMRNAAASIRKQLAKVAK